MIRRSHLIAIGLVAASVVAACDGPQGSSPTALSASTAPSANRDAERGGALHVTKECSTFEAHKGDICTITSSNLEAIPVGSMVLYATAAVGTALDTDILLYVPGRGHNAAFGHCTLDLSTGIGRCRFTGGTGTLEGFHANVAVSPLGWPNFAWDGKYQLSGRGEED